MSKTFLSRRFIIGLSANGVVFIRDTKAGPDKEFAAYALPVYSTDTREEADAIVVRKAVLAHNNQHYIWPGVDGDVDVLDAVAQEMNTIHLGQLARKAVRTS